MRTKNTHTQKNTRAENKGDAVRSGQTLAYVEQLGTYVEIKTPAGGEVAKFRVRDGAPVEYGQVIAELAPQFTLASPAS